MPVLPETFWTMTDGAKIICLLIIALTVLMLAGLRHLGAYVGRRITRVAEAIAVVDENAKHAAGKAEQAAQAAAPVSNGFAAGVRADLGVIIASQAELRAAVADLREHQHRFDGRLDRLESRHAARN